MTRLDRRAFLLGATSLGVLAACSGDDDDSSAGSENGDDPVGSAGGDDNGGENIQGTPKFLVRSFPDGFAGPSIFTAGSEQRMPFVLRDDIDIMRSNAPATAEIVITLDGEQVGGGVIDRRDEGLITPYYPLFFTPPSAGTYTATLTGADPIDFLVLERDELAIVKVGDPMRSVSSPTVDDARGVDPICTRAIPCPFHDTDLADALTNGKPTALVIATPGFCQTDVCGPVVDLLIDEADGRSDLNAIHAEVYTDPSLFDEGQLPPTTDVVNAYSLPFEPQMLVADGAGTIVARLDVTWDRSELREALALIG